MAKRFNLADLLPAEERSDSDHLEIREIPWDRIRANEANFYGVKDVEELARSIEMHGLLDPIVVTPAEPGWYTLISGHRRHKAWGELREKDPEKYAEIPAIVREFSSASMAELALIMANSSARVLSPAEVSRQAERVERLLYDLKEEGYEFPGRMRDTVAKACQVSSTKLARLKVIRENLRPAWTEKWEKNELAEDPAYQMARLPAEFQDRLAKVLKKPTGEQITKVANLYSDGVRWDNPKGLKCPDGTPCRHNDSFLIHDAKCYSYSMCRGKTCCLECREATGYGACQSACSKAVAMRNDQKAQEKAKAEANRKRELTKLRKSMTASAARLVRALDAGDPVADDEKIFSNWYGSLNAGEIRAMAQGTFDKWDRLRYSSDPLLPDKLDAGMVRKLSTLTGASADWIMGLSEEMFPEEKPENLSPDTCRRITTNYIKSADYAPEWICGDPQTPGRYLCTVDMGTGSPHEQTCDWRDGKWSCYGRDLDDLFRVLFWWPLPPRCYKPIADWQTELDEEGDEDE